MVTPDDVLRFWLDEVGPAGWYKASETLDAEVRERFLAAWQNAREGAYGLWLTYPNGMLAYVILTDQFPRNMFRDDARAFATDQQALAAGKVAINRGWDLRIDEPARQFFYLPLMHSENLCDQERCVRLMCERMPEHGAQNLTHARASRGYPAVWPLSLSQRSAGAAIHRIGTGVRGRGRLWWYPAADHAGGVICDLIRVRNC
tara:strand:- start:362 stop:970 length:609 start_codon:yes stop_codon:yes gene_type:complete